MNTLFDTPMTPRTTDEWYTPSWLFRAAGITFDLDVCAPVDPMLRTVPADACYTVEDDGLAQPWHGVVWMNPPYSHATEWVRRWAEHGCGMALLPALPEVAWRGVLMNAADAVALLFCEFGRPDGTVARLRWPLILAAAGRTATNALPLVAAADMYAAGAYHVRPGVSLL